MLSYRHAFHAGNHADTLKHCVLLFILDYLRQKDTPLLLVDTHAGGGLYDLGSEEAQKKAEYRDGIARLWEAAPEKSPEEPPPQSVSAYLEAVRAVNAEGTLRHYPGSPWLMRQRLRSGDALRLFERHPNEARALERKIPPRGGVRVFHEDGFAKLKALLPPPSRRAFVLLDPSYETRGDYAAVPAVLKDALTRLASGVYMVWYPRIARKEAHDLPERLKRLSAPWLSCVLHTRAPTEEGHGLYGSGLFILNPPWTLFEEAQVLLPWLVKRLASGEKGAGWTLERGQTRAKTSAEGKKARYDADTG
ncbi:MAG: 23S rRNA (adenine(2030)-N(6))-methyltransferase RlmJ [Zoogloeaceae bacterium]|jgi:23S rRNA (adenine2030-N6)-methyltransferase|nr:23S rRNA (adenine(2030)-N(6))-methyltransferase RlmJ [Zoogloeaceae bacterium]